MADFPVTVVSVKIALAEPFSGEIRASINNCSYKLYKLYKNILDCKKLCNFN